MSTTTAFRYRPSLAPLMTPLQGRSMRPALFAASLVGLAVLGGCAAPRDAATSAPVIKQALDATHPQHAVCPTGLPETTRCLSGRDDAGAYWWIAVPTPWTGVLVMHAHGGPELGSPKPERSAEDLQRWSIMVKAGHAWAGSTYRQGGVEVRAAAEDTERLRALFSRHVAAPRRTVLHGQSWGASVAAIGAEMFPASYDGVFLTSGVLGGGTRSYDFRLDLRVVYQAVCGDHPRADEPQYPLWMGLPEGSSLTRAELARRVNACTGVQLPAAKRSPKQAAALDTLLRQAKLPERSLIGHLNWATWHFQDIAFKRTGGRNPFGNMGAVYTSATDQAGLNQRVARYAPDAQAVAKLAADTDPQGRISMPVVSVRGVNDPIAFVELDSVFRAQVARQGRSQWLVQNYADYADHSYLSDAEYPAAMDALLNWIERGERPTPQSIAARCPASQAKFGGTCKFLPDYRAAELDERVTPRQR